MSCKKAFLQSLTVCDLKVVNRATLPGGGGGGGSGGATGPTGPAGLEGPTGPQGTESGTGGFFEAALWVDASYTGAEEKGTELEPFRTISAAITEAVALQDALPVGPLRNQRGGYEQVFIIAGGVYDQPLDILRGNTFYSFYALGPVIVGNILNDGGAPVVVSPQNVTWANSQGVELSDRGGVGTSRRPQLVFGALQDVGPMSSTHTSWVSGWHFSGDLFFTTLGGAPNTSTTEVHLDHVKVYGEVGVTGGGDFGIRNCYIRDCFFDNTFNFPNANLNLVKGTEFDGLITVATWCQFVSCEIQGGMTVQSVSSNLPPQGMYLTDFAGTFTSAGDLLLDFVTNHWFKANAASTAGGGTKVFVADTVL